MANPSDRKVIFGALRVGQTSQRNLKLVNRSPAPITFTLAITPSVVALQQANILTINPSTEITLRANGGSCGVELTFKPKTRIPHFTEEVSSNKGCFTPCQLRGYQNSKDFHHRVNKNSGRQSFMNLFGGERVSFITR